jgi:hypothetical protein
VCTALRSPRWNGKRPLIIFHGHDLWSSELVSILKKRQKKQGVLFLVDEGYGGKTYGIEKMADVTITLGKTMDTMQSLLKARRIEPAVDLSSISSVLDEVHINNTYDYVSLPQIVSDIDVLMYNIPSEILSTYLTLGCTVPTYKNVRKPFTEERERQSFLKRVINPLVALESGGFLSLSDTLEYTSYAHMIKSSPMLMQHPRDDQSEKLVRNCNDKIRIFMCRDSKKRKFFA